MWNACCTHLERPLSSSRLLCSPLKTSPGVNEEEVGNELWLWVSRVFQYCSKISRNKSEKNIAILISLVHYPFFVRPRRVGIKISLCGGHSPRSLYKHARVFMWYDYERKLNLQSFLSVKTKTAFSRDRDRSLLPGLLIVRVCRDIFV